MTSESRRFLVYPQWRRFFTSIPNPTDAVKLIDAMFAYSADGELTDFSDSGAAAPYLNAIFSMIKDQLDIDRAKYDEVCEKNRANGQRGGVAKAAKHTSTDRYQSLPTATERQRPIATLSESSGYDNDIDSDIDTDSDTENDNNPDNKKEYTSGEAAPNRSVGIADPITPSATSKQHEPTNWQIVIGQIKTAHEKLSEEGSDTLSLNETIVVFQRFYKEYETRRGMPHPNLSQAQIKNAVWRIRWDEEGDAYSLDDYDYLIPGYFRQKFNHNCNYSIIHFLSGNIRANRQYWNDGGY